MTNNKATAAAIQSMINARYHSPSAFSKAWAVPNSTLSRWMNGRARPCKGSHYHLLKALGVDLPAPRQYMPCDLALKARDMGHSASDVAQALSCTELQAQELLNGCLASDYEQADSVYRAYGLYLPYWSAQQTPMMFRPELQAWPESLVDYIKRHCKGSNTRFAKKFGIGEATVSRWTRGNTVPTTRKHRDMLSSMGFKLPGMPRGKPTALRLAREHRGWTVHHCASMLGIAKSTWIKIELGSPAPDKPIADVIYDELGVVVSVGMGRGHSLAKTADATFAYDRSIWGHRLRKARIRRNLTRPQLCKALGLKQATLHELENRSKPPKIRFRYSDRICRYLGRTDLLWKELSPSQRLRLMMERHGWNVEQTADAAGIAASSITDLLYDRIGLKAWGNLCFLLEALDMSFEQIWHDSDPWKDLPVDLQEAA